jgi:hypothetical protein
MKQLPHAHGPKKPTLSELDGKGPLMNRPRNAQLDDLQVHRRAHSSGIGDWHKPADTTGLVALCFECMVNPRSRDSESELRCMFCDHKRKRRLGRKT